MNKLSFFVSSDDFTSINQTDAQAYGPVKDSEASKYKVTSNISLNDKNLYSVVDGELIICNVTGQNDKVNIILKPKIDFHSSYFKGSPKVKYFIYRGVKKSSFFDNAGEPLVSTSPLNQIVRSYNMGGSTTTGLAPADRRANFKSSLTAITALNNSILVDLLFNKEDYYQIDIKKGDKIGVGSTDFGFEIMLQETGFNPDMALARELKNTIDTTVVGLSVTDKELLRLDVLNYIDPAAYFGLFFRYNSRIDDPKTGKQVGNYRACYTKFLSKLYTGSTIYLDIRNKYALPITINKSGDSFSQIKVSVNGSTPSTVRNYKYFKYGTSTTSNWPIHIINETFSNSTGQKYYDYFKIKVAVERKGSKELFHVLTNHLSCSWLNDKPYKHSKRYQKLIQSTSNASWNNHVELRTYKGTNTKPVASYIRVEIGNYSDENKIKNQIVNYKLNNLTAEEVTHQLSPTLINLGNVSDLTREKTPSGNVYKSTATGLGHSFYSENRGVACELTQGKVADSIGEVCFAYKTEDHVDVNKIDLSTVILPEKGTSASSFNHEAGKQAFAYNYIKEYFTLGANRALNKKTAYFDKVAAYNDHRINKSLISVHKVKFVHSGNVKKGLEIRVNDPMMLRGLTGNSPAECFTSIAYTNTQKQTIQTKITSSFLTERFVSFVSNTPSPVTVPTGEKQVFVTTFKLLGLKSNANVLELQEENLAITFYSLDGINYVTSEYADGFRNEIGEENTQVDRIINNTIIPQFISGNPFDTTLFTNIKTKIEEISNSGSRDQVLYNEIRDYVYDGDLDNLTFEMAFRLPFYVVDMQCVPYSDMVSVTTTTTFAKANTPYAKKSVNSPYFRNFKEWFDKANALRTAGNIPVLKRTGLTKDIEGFSQEVYSIFGFIDSYLTDDATKVHKTEKVPAYRANIMYDENRPPNHSSPYKSKPHLPANPSGTLVKVKQSELIKLKNAGVITLTTKTKLDVLANTHSGTFGFCTDVVKGSHGNITLDSGTFNFDTNKTNYIFKPSAGDGDEFYIYLKPYLSNASATTFGFGIDIGQVSMDSFKAYTSYKDGANYPPDWKTILQGTVKKLSSSSITNVSKYNVLKDEIQGKKGLGGGAGEAFKVFQEILNELDFTYSTAVKLGSPFIGTYEKKSEKKLLRTSNYPILMVNPLLTFTGSTPNLSATGIATIPSNSPYYFETGGQEYMNEMEKFLFTTLTYNGSGSGGNMGVNWSKVRWSRIGRYVAQAVNTHDLRWLKVVLKSPVYFSSKHKWALITESRIGPVGKVLNNIKNKSLIRTKIND